MIRGEWAQPDGSSDSDDADWGCTYKCIQLRVWWKLGYPRWSPLLQGSIQMASNHAVSWPGLHSMMAGAPNWEANDAGPCKVRAPKSIAFSGSKQITEQGQIHLVGRIAKNVELKWCVSTLTSTNPQALSPVILTLLVWGRTWATVFVLGNSNT